MGVQYSYPYHLYSYKDVQNCIQMGEDKCIIINTLEEKYQECLIKNTCCISNEEDAVNHFLHIDKTIQICIYGKHSSDTKVFEKYDQIKKLGFQNVYIYAGGLFEWLCLQDIYGTSYFPTTYIPKDILDYSPEIKNSKQIRYN
jgi:hypothetical protein